VLVRRRCADDGLERRGSKYKASAERGAYGAGLRAAEVTATKVGDIDSKRMVIRRPTRQRFARRLRDAVLASARLLTRMVEKQNDRKAGCPGARPRAAV